MLANKRKNKGNKEVSQGYHPCIQAIEKHKDLQHKNPCHFQFVAIPSSSSSNKPCFRKISSNHHIDTSSRLSANEPRFFCHNFYQEFTLSQLIKEMVPGTLSI